jgi:hypothetical protein
VDQRKVAIGGEGERLGAGLAGGGLSVGIGEVGVAVQIVEDDEGARDERL